MKRNRGKPYGFPLLFFILARLDLVGLGHGAGTQATGAGFDSLNFALVQSPYFLKVGVPNLAGFVMSVADVIASGRFLTTDITYSGHVLTSWRFRAPICSMYGTVLQPVFDFCGASFSPLFGGCD